MDHDLFIKHNEETGEYAAKQLEATFYDRDTRRVKYDDSEQYWRDFVGKWWHHTDLQFTSVVLTAEQQARLDEINAESIDARYLSQVANYVQFGCVDPEIAEPYLAILAEDPDVIEARINKLRFDKAQVLAAHRYNVETAGITLPNGLAVHTDRDAQSQLNSAYQSLKEGFAPSADWKAPTGWSTVTLTEITPIAKACFGHVQMCFSSERYVDELMTAETDYDLLSELSVEAEFDTKLAEMKATAAEPAE